MDRELLPDRKPAVPSVEPRRQALLRREGEYWTIVYDNATVRVRHSKGMGYLAMLLARPQRRVGCIELAAAAVGGAVDSSGDGEGGSRSEDERERKRSAVTKQIKFAVARIAAHHPSLGWYLRQSVRTGFSCVYEPGPSQPVSWVLSNDPLPPHDTGYPLTREKEE